MDCLLDHSLKSICPITFSRVSPCCKTHQVKRCIIALWMNILRIALKTLLVGAPRQMKRNKQGISSAEKVGTGLRSGATIARNNNSLTMITHSFVLQHATKRKVEESGISMTFAINYLAINVCVFGWSHFFHEYNRLVLQFCHDYSEVLRFL